MHLKGKKRPFFFVFFAFDHLLFKIFSSFFYFGFRFVLSGLRIFSGFLIYFLYTLFMRDIFLTASLITSAFTYEKNILKI